MENNNTSILLKMAETISGLNKNQGDLVEVVKELTNRLIKLEQQNAAK